MSGDYLSVFNASNGYLQDSDIQNAIPDWQAQLNNEFPWFWGNTAYIDFSGSGTPIVITDYPGANDPAGALGYHYIDGNYQPYARVFAHLSADSGVPWTGVASHEILETCADQLIDTTDLYDNGDGTGFIVLQEVCDPCEALLYTGAVNGNPVSDFATPAWYAPGDLNQVDYLNQIAGPWQLAAGGYVSYQLVQLGGWQQATADKVAQIAEQIRKQIATKGNPPANLVKGLQRAAVAQAQPKRVGAAQRQIPQQYARQPQRAGVQQRQQGGLIVPVGPRIQTKPTGQVRVLPAPDTPPAAVQAA
jgi:hypothetical protein